jgi:hypothetical protein
MRSALKDRGLGEVEMAALKAAHDGVRDKLRPKLAGYGLIDDALWPAMAAVEGKEQPE